MKKIFLILPFVAINAASAVSMCVPKVAGYSASAVAAGSAVGNRGQFVFGTNCISGTGVCKMTLIRGETHCSAFGDISASNWENFGQYCWVRFTHVRTPNGYLATQVGGWIRLLYDSYNACASSCASNAVNAIVNNSVLRRTLFATPENRGGL